MRLFPYPLRQSIFYGTRDQPQPGSFLHKREEPGNEVGKDSGSDISTSQDVRNVVAFQNGLIQQCFEEQESLIQQRFEDLESTVR